MSWKKLAHHPYSPDLAPSDFNLFGPPKEKLRGTNSRITRTSKSFWEIGSNVKKKKSLHKCKNLKKRAKNNQKDYKKRKEKKYCFVKIHGFSSRPILLFNN